MPYINSAAIAALILALAGSAWADKIVVGQVAPLTGAEASQGRAYAAGMQLRFDTINRRGGINGHTFHLVNRDDASRPEHTVTQTQQLIAEDRPMVLAGYFGSKNLQALVQERLLEKSSLTLIGYRAADIRLDTPRIFGVRASLRDEIAKILEHLSTIGITRVGLLYEEGNDAQAVIAEADDAARKFSVSVTTRAAYPANTTNVAAAVQTFLKQSPQAIILLSSGSASAAFIEGYRAGRGAAQMFAHSGADIEQLSKRLAEEQLQGVAIAQVTPSPYRITSRLAKELVEAASSQPNGGVAVSFAMMEGYIAASVIAEAVRRQGRTPTKPGMSSALESIENYDLGGYVVNYKTSQRTGSRFVELSIVNSSGRIRQ